MVGPIDAITSFEPEAEWHQVSELGERSYEVDSILPDPAFIAPIDMKKKVSSLFPDHPVLGLEISAKHVDGWLSKKQKDDVASMIASDNFIRF